MKKLTGPIKGHCTDKKSRAIDLIYATIMVIGLSHSFSASAQDAQLAGPASVDTSQTATSPSSQPAPVFATNDNVAISKGPSVTSSNAENGTRSGSNAQAVEHVNDANLATTKDALDASGAAEAAVPALQPPAHDLSPVGMFLAADIVVKGVMLLLIAASVVTWAVMLLKFLTLAIARRRIRATVRALSKAGTLAEAAVNIRNGIGLALLRETEDEKALSNGLGTDGIKERIWAALTRIEMAECRRIAVGTGILATVGSVGPFVGLFGTVWGIMRSFIGIANSNTTNLAVVAPGIAEALLATGIGLVAAIPAVVIYNSLSRSISNYRAMIGDAVTIILRHVSRDLDRQAAAVEQYGAGNGTRVAAE